MRAIDADALRESVLELPNCCNGFSDTYDKAFIIGVIDEQPTIEERKTGKWINRSLNILYPEWERYTCSVCGKHSNGYDYCPNCGADMRGEEE